MFCCFLASFVVQRRNCILFLKSQPRGYSSNILITSHISASIFLWNLFWYKSKRVYCSCILLADKYFMSIEKLKVRVHMLMSKLSNNIVYIIDIIVSMQTSHKKLWKNETNVLRIFSWSVVGFWRYLGELHALCFS